MHISEARRIAVIGCPGAGKSTFSRHLAEKTGLPIIHLDFYYHDKIMPYYLAKDRVQWLAKLKSLVNEPSWIMDGNYKSTFEMRFETADVVLLLDFPRHLLLWRVFKRRWQYRESSTKTRVGVDMADGWKEKIDWEFIKMVWNYRRDQLPLIAKIAEDTRSQEKIVTFTSPGQLSRFLETLDEHVSRKL